MPVQCGGQCNTQCRLEHIELEQCCDGSAAVCTQSGFLDVGSRGIDYIRRTDSGVWTCVVIKGNTSKKFHNGLHGACTNRRRRRMAR